MTQQIVKNVGLLIDQHLQVIAGYFKNPKITIVVRAPDLVDGDMVMTSDDLGKAIAAIQKLRAREIKDCAVGTTEQGVG